MIAKARPQFSSPRVAKASTHLAPKRAALAENSIPFVAKTLVSPWPWPRPGHGEEVGKVGDAPRCVDALAMLGEVVCAAKRSKPEGGVRAQHATSPSASRSLSSGRALRGPGGSAPPPRRGRKTECAPGRHSAADEAGDRPSEAECREAEGDGTKLHIAAGCRALIRATSMRGVECCWSGG